MDERPEVSVIVPTYNSEKYITKSLESFSNQTLSAIEWIFVDDGSRDGTASIIEKIIESGKIKGILLKCAENGGAGKARNVGVLHARGKYISFMDSDDIIFPEKYKKMVEAAKAWGGADLVVSGLVYLQNYGETAKKLFYFTDPAYMYMMEKRGAFSPKEFPELLNSCYLWNRIYNREWYLNNGIKIPEGRRFAEDLLPCVMSTVLAEKIVYVTEPMSIYMQHKGSLTDGMNNAVNKIDLIKAISETKDFLVKTHNYDWAKLEFLRFVCSIAFGLGWQIQNKRERNKYYSELKEVFDSKDAEDLKKLNFNNIYPEAYRAMFFYD